MSFLYRFLGIPRTFDEFVDFAKKKRIKEIVVAVPGYNKTRNKTREYRCLVGLVAGGRRVKLNEYTYFKTGILSQVVVGKLVVEREAFKKAMEIGERLVGLGFEVDINGEPIGNVLDVVEEYDKQIRKTCQKYRISKPSIVVSST